MSQPTQVHEYLGSHPILGAFISSISIIFSIIIQMMAGHATEMHIPPVIMEVAQMVAWTTASIVATLTIYGFFEKRWQRPNDEWGPGPGRHDEEQ